MSVSMVGLAEHAELAKKAQAAHVIFLFLPWCKLIML